MNLMLKCIKLSYNSSILAKSTLLFLGRLQSCVQENKTKAEKRRKAVKMARGRITMLFLRSVFAFSSGEVE